MTDMQAALGISQLKRLDAFVTRRHEISKKYDDSFKDCSFKVPYQHPDNYSARHLYVIQLNQTQNSLNRRQIVESLQARGIQANVHYIPVHLQPFFKSMGFGKGDFIEAERYYEEAISLPIYFNLTDKQVDYIKIQLYKFFKKYES